MSKMDSSKISEPLLQPGSVGAPTLLLAGPTLELVDQWAAELLVLRRRSPSSDAVETLSSCIRELVEAIKAAKDMQLHLTIADVHATSGIPVSTLRWLCKHKPGPLGAQKHKGVWYVNRAKFERYMATSDRDVPLGSTSDGQRMSGAVEAA